MEIYKIFGLAGGILLIPVYIIYLIQVKKSQSTPNPATWSIWVAVMILNGATYTTMTGDILESLIAITAPILLIILFSYISIKGKFTKLGKTEKKILALTFIIGILWKITSATFSNLCLQAIILFSFWPTIKGLIKGDHNEKPLPWILASVAYLLTVAGNILNLQGNWFKLVFPFVNGVMGNGSVALLSFLQNRKNNITPN